MVENTMWTYLILLVQIYCSLFQETLDGANYVIHIMILFLVNSMDFTVKTICKYHSLVKHVLFELRIYVNYLGN